MGKSHIFVRQSLLILTLVLAGLFFTGSYGHRFPRQQAFRLLRRRIRNHQHTKLCPQGYELRASPRRAGVGNKFECRCKRYHLYWPQDGLCYRENSRGPCEEGHRLVLNETTRQAECSCPFFWTKLPDGKCYKEYTRGPCPYGQLVVSDPFTNQGSCDCSSDMKMYHYNKTGECFELYDRGPCPLGHVLDFNYKTLDRQCRCKDGHHLHVSDGNCYKLNTKGPCENELRSCEGTPCLLKSIEAIDVQCNCLPSNSTTKDGRCFQPYTTGPCRFGEWLVFNKNGEGVCEEKKYCKRFDNWHWWSPHQRCYRQFSQGPCRKGKLFYLNESGTGCHCQKEWKAYFWNETQECYEQESPGPCPEGQYFAYNRTSRQPECNCFKNFVSDPSTGTCIEQFTSGSCPKGTLVVKKDSTIACDCGPHLQGHYWASDGKCYPHYERGPCKEGEQFRLNPRDKLRPACIVWGTK
ncbi:uncharacterized protein [Lepeophtheirus salmonis]|nr:uncharacterized protein LOC121119172 [Lepeophtheirus salmonis]